MIKAFASEYYSLNKLFITDPKDWNGNFIYAHNIQYISLQKKDINFKIKNEEDMIL